MIGRLPILGLEPQLDVHSVGEDANNSYPGILDGINNQVTDMAMYSHWWCEWLGKIRSPNT